MRTTLSLIPGGRDQKSQPANPTFAHLFDQAVDAFVQVERQGLLTDANPVACALLGRTRDDLLGRALTAFGKPVIRGRIGAEDAFGFAEESGMPKPTDNGRMIEPSFVADVTRHHRLLDALVETSLAAKMAEKAKREFLSNMSHELRTPIGGILGLSTLLRQRIEPGHALYLDLIIQSAEGLAAVVGDILDMARIENSWAAPGPMQVELAPALAQLFEDIRRQAQAKDLEATLSISQRVPEKTVLAWDLTRKALGNLLSNAVKFTSKGWVYLFVDHCVDEADRECLYFAVIDSGLGIASEDLPRLFQPFTQLERPLNKHVQGTGLGLALAKRLAELAGGSIWLDSEPGRGSTFHLRVPCASPSGPDKAR